MTNTAWDQEITLLGASGFLGKRILLTLEDQGIPVCAISRGERPLTSPKTTRWIQTDVVTGDVKALQIGGNPTISTLPIWLTADLVSKALEFSRHRFVAFSSMSAISKANSRLRADRQLSRQLQQGELQLFNSHPEATILRTTMIYGGPGDQNVERIAQMLRRLPFFPLVGGGAGLRQPLHVEDAAAAAFAAVSSTKVVGKTYFLAGSEVLPVSVMIRQIAQAREVPLRFVPVPTSLIRGVIVAASAFPAIKFLPLGFVERQSLDLSCDTSQASADFGFQSRPFSP